MKRFTMMAIGAILILASSCTSSKKLIYLQENKKELVVNQEITNSSELKIQNDDLLYITISSKDAELIEPFKNATLIGATSSTTNAATGFLVNNEGFINLPSLGQIFVRGLTSTQIADKIEKLLIKGNYIKDPVVTVRLGNFKVTVLGEVSNPGTIEVIGNRVTILEAISQRGDLKPTAKRKNIKILREIDGKRNIYTVDITKANLVESPYYYLSQNDIIYVEPNKTIGAKSSPWLTALGIGGTVLSLVLSVITLIAVTN